MSLHTVTHFTRGSYLTAGLLELRHSSQQSLMVLLQLLDSKHETPFWFFRNLTQGLSMRDNEGMSESEQSPLKSQSIQHYFIKYYSIKHIIRH